MSTFRSIPLAVLLLTIVSGVGRAQQREVGIGGLNIIEIRGNDRRDVMARDETSVSPRSRIDSISTEPNGSVLSRHLGVVPLGRKENPATAAETTADRISEPASPETPNAALRNGPSTDEVRAMIERAMFDVRAANEAQSRHEEVRSLLEKNLATLSELSARQLERREPEPVKADPVATTLARIEPALSARTNDPTWLWFWGLATCVSVLVSVVALLLSAWRNKTVVQTLPVVSPTREQPHAWPAGSHSLREPGAVQDLSSVTAVKFDGPTWADKQREAAQKREETNAAFFAEILQENLDLSKRAG